MRKIVATLLVICSIVFFSCQPEVGFDSPSGGGGSGGGGGNTNGDLLVKALEISLNTNDTNVITFKYDNNKRMTEYYSTGRLAGIDLDIRYTITRLADGKIQKAKATSSLTSLFIDSVIYNVHYVTGTDRMAYVLATTYSGFLGDFTDSTVQTYDASGKIIKQESYSALLGPYELSTKEDYIYDANGNITKTTVSEPDGSGGFDVVSTRVTTYDNHKAAIPMKEEGFIFLGAENVSKNNIVKCITDGSTSGTTYTTDITNQKFNSFDRPTEGKMIITPKPPGYDLKVLYYYQ